MLKKFTVSLSLLLAAAAVHAAEPVFDVEVVVFKHLDSEFYSGDPEAILSEREWIIPDGEDSDLVTLNPTQLQLGGAVARLRQSAAFRPLLHTGWRQPVLSRQLTSWIPIDTGDELPEFPGTGREFEGAVRIYNNSGLVIDLDILMRAETEVPTEPEETFEPETGMDINADSETDPETGLVQEPASDLAADADELPDASEQNAFSWQSAEQEPELMVTVRGATRLRETRKVDSDNLQYFDHPNFGVLVKLTPWSAPLDDSEPDTGGLASAAGN